MKKLIGLLIGTILTISSFAQDVTIPEKVLDNMIEELIIKDDCIYKLNKLDSTISVYKHSEAKNLEKIQTYRLKAEEYKAIVERQEKIIEIQGAEIKDTKKQGRKGALKAFGGGTITGIIFTIILIIVI